MWEIYTAKRPWAGLTQDQIASRVSRRGLRPQFPTGAPPAYAALAAACWAPAPGARPGMRRVLAELAGMAAGACGGGA